MTNRVKALSIVIVIFFIVPAITSAEDSWLDKITITKEVGNKEDASIHFTNPKDGEASYAVDLGVVFPVKETDQWVISPTVEYHRNTALKKEQDTLKGGLKGSYRFGEPAKLRNGVFKPSFAVWVDGQLDYTRDGEKNTDSWTPKVAFTPLYSPWGLGSSIGNDQIRVQLNLKGELVYEKITSGEDGDTVRSAVIAGLVVHPLNKKLQKKLKLQASNKYWNELTRSGNFDDENDSFNLFTIDATYYLYRNPDPEKDDKLGIKLAYQNGADPDSGLEDQSFVSLGLVFTL